MLVLHSNTGGKDDRTRRILQRRSNLAWSSSSIYLRPKGRSYELGFWVGLLYIAAYVSLKWEFVPLAVGTAVCIRMVMGLLSEMDERKRITRDIERHFDEAYPKD